MSTITSSVRYAEGHFRNRRGLQLFYCSFFPSHVSVKGVVLFLHGIGEHSHRFVHLYEHLVELGFAVIAYDMVGHGRSDCECEGLRAHAEAFEHFVQDTNDFLTAAKYSIYKQMLPENAPEPPLYFMGISYGCLVGLHTILSGEHPFSGIVLASPALGVEKTLLLTIQGLLSKPLVAAFPHARIVPGVNFEGLTRDPHFYQDYMADRLNVTENMTARMGVNTLGAMQHILESKVITDRQSAFCKTPLLLIQGSADKVTSSIVAQAFYNRIGTFDKEMKLYDGLFHCIYNEPEKAQVIEHVTSWLLARANLQAAIETAKPKRATPPLAKL
ncbi:hypothetical protein Poli38472_010697 [Pythium oligandrum]|uniref:Serine aminopeptidase S33 domain-containing protein n=1 Tax=Pythium oligandrum TaxID=41045 RepID=A0A8K1FI25_PYTOL|nr:hypothetical protein Poli38472_010697 [Pythium oligandrum]|eukprot:TMW61634.1 hypothetical protein Poli38472_010697 [Pythium oligandrum]